MHSFLIHSCLSLSDLRQASGGKPWIRWAWNPTRWVKQRTASWHSCCNSLAVSSLGGTATLLTRYEVTYLARLRAELVGQKHLQATTVTGQSFQNSRPAKFRTPYFSIRVQVQFDGSDCQGVPTEIWHVFAPFLGIGGYAPPQAWHSATPLILSKVMILIGIAVHGSS